MQCNVSQTHEIDVILYFTHNANSDIIAVEGVLKLDKKTINFTLRMTHEQRFQLDRIAHEQSRTTTNLINMILKQYIEEWHVKKNKGRD